MAYKLYIEQIVTDWYFERGFGKWIAIVSDEDFEEIKKNPMQDYVRFGVQSIDYTRIEAYKIEEIEHEDYTEVREYKEPIVIEEGSVKMSDEAWERFLMLDFEKITI